MSTLSPFDMVDAARYAVYRHLPYFMRMLFKLTPVERKGIDTFFVDDKLRVHYDADLVVKWGVDACATVLAHEVQHPIGEHMKRGNLWLEECSARWAELRTWLERIHPLLGRSPAFFWNVVADIEINPTITAVGLKWPEGFTPVFPKTFGLTDGKLAEEYAVELFARAEKMKQDEAAARPPQTMPSSDADESGSMPGMSMPKEADDETDADADGEASGVGDEPADGDADANDGEVGEGAAEAPPSDGATDDSGDENEQEDEPTPGAVDGCCGSCSAHAHPEEATADEADMPKGVSEGEVDIARRQVAHDTLEPTSEMKRLMNQFGKGTVPGSLKAWAEAQLRPSEVPWQRLLAPLVRDAVAFARGRVDWSHRRPHRRQGVMSERNGGFGPILPSLVAPVPNIGIVVDTSGSMSAMTRDSRTHLDEALSEVSSIVLSVGVPVWCAAVDAQVQGWVRVKAKSDVSKLIAGGGGTDMCVGIKAAEEKKFDIIVLVTDGYTNWPTPETMPRNSRLVVCCTTDASVPTHIRHVVRIDAEGKKGIRA